MIVPALKSSTRLHAVAFSSGSRRGVFVVLSLLALALMPRIASAHGDHDELPSEGAEVHGNELLLSEQASQALGVQLAKVSLGGISQQVRARTRLQLPWRQHSLVTTLIPGRIAEVLVRPGDQVEQGEVLARIESLELETLQLELLQTAAQQQLLETQLARQQLLANQGVIAGSALNETQAALQQARAEREIVTCKLRAVGLSSEQLDAIRTRGQPLRRLEITSPQPGLVAEVDVRPGQAVETTAHLFHIVNLAELWAIGEVLEEQLDQVQTGQPASVVLTALPEMSLRGHIAHRHPSVDPTRRTQEVVVPLRNPPGRLQVGMFGTMTIEVQRKPDAILCPTEAILDEPDGAYALVRQSEGRFERKRLEIGLRSEEQVEIVEGLFPGDQVITTGAQVLAALFRGGQIQDPHGHSQGAVGSHDHRARSSTKRRASGAAAGTSRQRLPRPEARSSPTAPGRVAAHPLSDEPVRSKPDAPTIVRGTVELPTTRKVFTSARLDGRLARIVAEHGQRVEQGQALGYVESLELRNLQGDLLSARNRLHWILQRLTRLEQLEQQNLGVQKELLQLQTEQRQQESTIASLRRKLALIGVDEEEIERLMQLDLSDPECEVSLVKEVAVRAPIAGWVGEFDLVPGQVVHANEQLFVVQDPSQVWVRGHVFQQDAASIAVGQSVEVTFAAYPDWKLDGRIVRMVPPVEDSHRVVPIWVEIDNREKQLLEGMYARIAVPRSAAQLAQGESPD